MHAMKLILMAGQVYAGELVWIRGERDGDDDAEAGHSCALLAHSLTELNKLAGFQLDSTGCSNNNN